MEKQKQTIIKWASKTVIDNNTIRKFIEDDSWRQCNGINY